MRKTCLDMVYELALKDERVVFVGSDLGVGTLDKLKAAAPDRFFMEGVSEANILGMATGLALEGRVVYVNTIATFLTRRSFEQVVVDLCLHNANVRLLGSGGGLVYAPLGPTHLAIEDIAVMRAVPRMTVIAPADASEMRRLMPLTVDYQGPIYIRLGKGGDPILTPDDPGYAIGKAVSIQPGSDALILTTGVMLKCALDAAAELARGGVRAGVLHVPTIKPLDAEGILAAAAPVRAMLTIEEHSVVGGFGSAVAEVVAEAGFSPAKRFRRMGIPDEFPAGYGSQMPLLARCGVSAEAAVAAVRDLLS